MKIAVNARLLLSNRMEGIARYIYETTKRMVMNHPEHEFHFYFDRPFKKPFINAPNIQIHVINPQARHPVLWYIWFELVLRKRLIKDKIDVLFSGESYLSLRSEIPCVMVSHDINYYHYPAHMKKSHLYYFRHYFPKYHRKADHIVAVSNFTKSDIIKAYNLDVDKISVAYNSAPEGFSPLDENNKDSIKARFTSGQDYFLYVGSLHPRKNVKRLIEAYGLFKSKTQSPVKLIIYGRSAWHTSEIKKAYDQSEYNRDIFFLGNNDVKVTDIMGAALALCYVSIFEGFGIPILEAFHAHVPVITSNVSSMPEVSGEAALTVNPLDIGEIASAMQRIYSDPELRTQLIRKGQLRKDDFSWETSARHIMDQIDRLVIK